MTTRVKVQMWNVGVGDCFLLSFETDGSIARVLIDCGTHRLSLGPRRADEAAQGIVAELLESGSPRLDVVVATHKHEDHISGFGPSDLWKQVEVGQVWLPWTQADTDPQAMAFRERQEAIRTAMTAMAARICGDDRRELVQAILAEALTNADAMYTLKHGFGGKPKRSYLAAGSAVEIPAAPHVKVKVLGPSRDPAVIRKLEPSGAGEWLAAVASAASGTTFHPFANGWWLPFEDVDWTGNLEHLMPNAQLRRTIESVTSDDLLQAASSLENGTSIVLVFSVGDLVLVFPGDAQWGTWEMILDKEDEVELLKRTSFLKVGHHGSLNATPPALIRKTILPEGTGTSSPGGTTKPILRKGTVAAISVGLGKSTVTDLDKVTAKLRDYGLEVFLSEDPPDNVRKEFEFVDDGGAWKASTIMATADGEHATDVVTGDEAPTKQPLPV